MIRRKELSVLYFFLRAMYMQIPIPPNNTSEVTTNMTMAEAGIIFSF
jgi:hypothetical protein